MLNNGFLVAAVHRTAMAIQVNRRYQLGALWWDCFSRESSERFVRRLRLVRRRTDSPWRGVWRLATPYPWRGRVLRRFRLQLSPGLPQCRSVADLSRTNPFG